MSFISMQAIEYVLWKNLKNDKINHQYSFYADQKEELVSE